MTKLNAVGVILGGVLAGLVMNVIDFIVNVPMLGARWAAETKLLNVTMANVDKISMAGWIVSDFVAGLLLVWIYAGIRPRFGPGPKTAVIASVTLWFTLHLGYEAFAFNGLYSFGLVHASALGGLVAALAGGQVGCGVYKES